MVNRGNRARNSSKEDAVSNKEEVVVELELEDQVVVVLILTVKVVVTVRDLEGEEERCRINKINSGIKTRN